VHPRVLIALFLLAASVFVGVLAAAATGDREAAPTDGERRFEGAVLPRGLDAPRFRLRDQDGEPVAMEDLRGRPVIVTFLYTHCEDSCPTQAQQVRSALDELGEEVPALAIAVEPERDTEESARAFLSEQRVLGRMRFVLGSRGELKKVWKAFGVEPQRDDLEHSGRFVLVDPEGVQRVSFPIDQATPERLAHDLRLLADGA
jgi:protein SCO1/2